MIEYTRKYEIESDGDTIILASNHAEWVMEEYAMRARIWVWLIPPIAPINAFAVISKIVIGGYRLWEM